MSGGHFDYAYAQIKSTYDGQMQDGELNVFLSDFCVVLYELEWWQSGDTGEEDYREAVKRFKEKWFGKRYQQLLDRTVKKLENVIEEIRINIGGL